MASLDDRPVRSLIVAFVAWKALLLLIAAGSSVSAPYDTSTSLLSPLSGSFNESVFDLPTRLTRWDAIYFVQVARRGYHFEQEWAFGSGLPALIALFAKGKLPFIIPLFRGQWADFFCRVKIHRARRRSTSGTIDRGERSTCIPSPLRPSAASFGSQGSEGAQAFVRCGSAARPVSGWALPLCPVRREYFCLAIICWIPAIFSRTWTCVHSCW